MHYKIAIAKIFFVCSFINFYKIRWCFNNDNKSLECMATFWQYIRLYYSLSVSLSDSSDELRSKS